MDYEWDENKAAINRQKHGVNFTEAIEVFDDPLAALFDDDAHSADEKREIIIGYTSHHRLLIVSFTERAGAIRLISARPMTSQERKEYETYVF